MLPRNYGLFPKPSESYHSFPQHIPEPPHFRFTERTPTAVTARRGQALVFTQSMLHASSPNFSPHPRKALIVSFVAAGVPFGVGSADGLSQHLAALRAALVKFAPGRQELVPSPEDYCHFDSGVNTEGGKFEETFLPGARL